MVPTPAFCYRLGSKRSESGGRGKGRGWHERASLTNGGFGYVLPHAQGEPVIMPSRHASARASSCWKRCIALYLVPK